MTKNDFAKLLTATVAVFSLAVAPALAQDPLSEGYGGGGNNTNEVCPEGTSPVGDIGGISDTPAGVDPSGGSSLDCGDVLGDTGEGGEGGDGGDGGNTPVNDPGSDPADPADPGDSAVAGQTASADTGDPVDPPSAEPAAARPVDSLPFTGADITLVAAMGVALFLLGLGLSLLTHRRSRLSL
ncbi:MAG: hypothetical protein MSC31_17380 [Solirubrobacteraceae bacterium MAG38_C4-C5]|nr:hypothetical protein [Candidatus Siliceabacter maunaloa]